MKQMSDRITTSVKTYLKASEENKVPKGIDKKIRNEIEQNIVAVEA